LNGIIQTAALTLAPPLNRDGDLTRKVLKGKTGGWQRQYTDGAGMRPR
jgi:hypothetical protein